MSNSRKEFFLRSSVCKLRHAIDRVAADNGEMRHAHHLHPAFFNQRQGLLCRRVAWPLRFHLLEKAFVDFENDLQVTWKNLLEEADAPLLQGLRK